MMIVQLDMKWRFLLQSEFLAGLIPQFLAIDSDLWRNNAIEDDDAVVGQHCQDFLHNTFQCATVTADKDCIRTRQGGDIRFEEVANMDTDAWGTEATGILLDDGLTLRTDLEGFDMQMWELQTGFYRDTARTETDVPQNLSLWQVECLQRQQTNGHLGDHFLSAIEQGKVAVGYAEGQTLGTVLFCLTISTDGAAGQTGRTVPNV